MSNLRCSVELLNSQGVEPHDFIVVTKRSLNTINNDLVIRCVLLN